MSKRLFEGIIDDLSDLISDVETAIEDSDDHPQVEIAFDELEKVRERLFEVYMEAGGGIVRRIRPRR